MNVSTNYFDEKQEQLKTNTTQFGIGRNIRENSELEVGNSWKNVVSSSKDK